MTTNDEFIDFEPMTEEEALGLLPVGEYESVIKKAENKQTSTGQKCLVFSIDIKGPKNKNFFLMDWLALPYKLKHFCDSTGLEDKYSSKQLKLSDCVGKVVKVKINVSKPTEKYPTPRNNVVDYFKSSEQTDLFEDKQLPF